MRYFLSLLACLLTISAAAQSSDPTYDPALADSLGADQYGMKPYVLAILKAGPTPVKDPQKAQELMQGHLANIRRLAQAGQLVVAGPLGRNEQGYRGIFIFNVAEPADAEALLQTDPAIAAGVFAVDLFPWYGSAALPVYLPVHERIAKEHP